MGLRDAAEMRRDLRDWLLLQNPGLAPMDLKDGTLLMEQGIVDSLKLMDLVLAVERLRGQALDMEDVKPGAFRSIEAISQAFFEARP